MKKALIFSVITSLFFISCNKDEVILDSSNTESEVKEFNIVYDYESELKRDFARALVIALNESQPLREFIKNEAIKMFDKDYDVLYQMIKNETLSNGESVRDLLIKYFDDKDKLAEIEKVLPLLTIFVPELPEESFSAKVWDTHSITPQVAIRMNNTNHVPIISFTGEEYIFEAGRIPSFPVIVIKENERLVVKKDNMIKRNDIKGSVIEKLGCDIKFQFLDDVFNGDKKESDLIQSNQKLYTAYYGGQKTLDAYNIYKNADGWHRDYIYYNLTPSNTKDQFSYDYIEQLRAFRLVGDPMNALNKISDQTGDPHLNIIATSPTSFWTGGFFEFKVRVLINAKNGVGTELITYFPASPDQLFNLTYTKYFWYYKVTSIESKYYFPKLNIFNWDLNQYASSIKVEIEEVDLTETIVITDTRTVKFANNFSIDIDGILKKIGLKFGSTLETTATHSVQKTYTLGNDELGSVIINFADDVILSAVYDPEWGFDFYNIREYATGWYSITFMPYPVSWQY